MQEQILPSEILERASYVGNEYAWRVRDIPAVIEAARRASLVNIGGNLQFRPSNGPVCDCYWVNVDTYKSVDSELPWEERVSSTASVALRDFKALQGRFDFVAEGRLAYGTHIIALAERGDDLVSSMWFVWEFISEALEEPE